MFRCRDQVQFELKLIDAPFEGDPRGLSSPRVTVIAFTYNMSKFIVEAMDSVLVQRTTFPFEVIILDDCSTDGTTEIARDYERRDPGRVRVVVPERNQNDHVMFAETCQDSRADYIALLDGDDDWTDPRKLQLQVDFLDSHPECALCFHNVDVWSDARSCSLGPFHPSDQPPISTLDDLLSVSFIQTSSAMIRRRSFVPLPDWYKELRDIGDWPLFLLAMRHGTAGYIDRIMGRYRQHAAATWSGRAYGKKVEQIVPLYDRFVGEFGAAYDEKIRLLLTSRCHELAFEQTLGPDGGAPSAPRVAEIAARVLARECDHARRVAGIIPTWSPEELRGASIDLPKRGATVDSRCFTLAGWAIGKDGPVVAVEVEEDGKLVNRVRLGSLRPDVAETFPGVKGAERSGFQAVVGVGGRTDRVALHAVTESGRRFAAGEIRLGPDVVPVLRPRLPRLERLQRYVRRIDESRIYSNFGPLSVELERRLSNRLGLPEGGLACAASGTAALAGAILAVAGRASEARPLALLPAFTFVATASGAEQCGYRAFLADIDPETWMLNPDRLLSHPELHRVGLIVPVAPFGRPVPQEPWRIFREKTGIPVVIDGAASLDCVVDAPDRFLGDIPVALSFHATKSFSTAEGGAVASTKIELTKLVSQALNFGFCETRDCAMPSTNGKMSEYHAAVGLAELDEWTEKLSSLHAVSNRYRSLLSPSNLAERLFAAPAISAAYVLFLCRDPGQCLGIRKALESRGVDFRLWYGAGLQHQTYFSSFERDELPITESVAPRLIGLPVAPDLSESAIRRVVTALEAGAGI